LTPVLPDLRPEDRDSDPDPVSEGPAGADRLRRVIITIIDGTISEETSLAEHWCSA
jgi:hypothetical protein